MKRTHGAILALSVSLALGLTGIASVRASSISDFKIDKEHQAEIDQQLDATTDPEGLLKLLYTFYYFGAGLKEKTTFTRQEVLELLREQTGQDPAELMAGLKGNPIEKIASVSISRDMSFNPPAVQLTIFTEGGAKISYSQTEETEIGGKAGFAFQVRNGASLSLIPIQYAEALELMNKPEGMRSKALKSILSRIPEAQEALEELEKIADGTRDGLAKVVKNGNAKGLPPLAVTADGYAFQVVAPYGLSVNLSVNDLIVLPNGLPSVCTLKANKFGLLNIEVMIGLGELPDLGATKPVGAPVPEPSWIPSPVPSVSPSPAN